MEEAIDNLYGKLQDENLDLMVTHVNQDEIPNAIEVEAIRVNHVLLTKLGQMKRQIKNIPLLKY